MDKNTRNELMEEGEQKVGFDLSDISFGTEGLFDWVKQCEWMQIDPGEFPSERWRISCMDIRVYC